MKLSIIKNIASIAGVCSILSSCISVSTVSYTFEQLRAADYTLPTDIKKVVITNCGDITLNDSLYNINGTNKNEIENREFGQNIPSLVCSVMSIRINDSGYLQTALNQKKIRSYSELLSSANDICKENEADAIIAIRSSVYSGEGYRDETKAYTRSALSHKLVFITKDGSIHQFEDQHDTLTWVAYLDELEALPAIKEMYYSVAEQSAKHIAAQIIPSWETRHRHIFSTANSKMIMAGNYVSRGEWAAAKDIWSEIAQKGKETEKCMSSANIGLFYEREDNALEAAMWFSKTLDQIEAAPKNKELQNIKRQVEMLFRRAIDRQHEKEILDKQMGGDE